MKKIGRRIGALALCAVVGCLTEAPALARGVGIEVDGRTYCFSLDGASEGVMRCEVDGKVFLVGEDEVIVQEDGKPDRHFSLEEEISADEVAAEAVPGSMAESVSEVVICSGGEGGESEATYFFQEGAEAASTSFASAEEDVCSSRAWSTEEAEEYAAYAPYGLSCDAAGKLYYLGQPVRIFEDSQTVDGGVAELRYFDEGGKVDVRSIRGAKGQLTGLEALSEAEFAARDLREWTNPAPAQIEQTATAGDDPTPEERAAFFAPYAPFGLRYDAATDKLYLNDRPVRAFLDVRASNGEPPTSGKFQGSMTQLRFDGELDVTILRDYTHPDANGEGKLIGIEATEAK